MVRAALPRTRAVLLGIVLLGSYAFFYEGGGWNQNTRFDLVRAIVERHTLRIDPYQDNTGDKALLGGHVYADKAPGASLMAVPAVTAMRFVLRAFRQDVDASGKIMFFSYVATVAAASVPAAVAAVCVFLLSKRFGNRDGASGIAAIACGLGTPLWAYATLLYGHALAAGCLAAALLGAVRLRDARTEGRALGFWTGLAAGWAVVTEFPAAVPSAMIALFACSGAGTFGERRRAALAVGSGLAVAAFTLLAYNAAAFGSPFHLGYSSETAGYEGMHTGIFGVGWPDPRIAVELLFGTYRGLLPLAPVLIVAPVGLWLLARDGATRGPGLVAAGIAIYYVLMTAGYAYWDGGWSYGSRHLGPALPFITLGIAPVWQRGGRAVRTGVLALLLVSVGESLVAVATTPQPPGIAPADPMRELLWPAFASGDFPIGWQSVLELRPPPGPMSELERRGVPRASWNLGQQMGLEGHASLLPLAALWIAGLVWWTRAGRATARDDPSHGRSARGRSTPPGSSERPPAPPLRRIDVRLA